MNSKVKDYSRRREPEKISPVTKELQEILTKKQLSSINPALLFRKYLFYEKIPQGEMGQQKSEWLDRYKSALTHRQTENEHKKFISRWNAVLDSFANTGILKKGQATPLWRVVVGLGGESILETDLTIHHIYGFPYIPGSALKGMTRHYVEKEYKDDPDISKIFGIGTEGKKKGTGGKVVFFDAMPLRLNQVELDIMTPHYQPYYQDPKRNPPADWYSPNPIAFLVCGKMKFIFALYSKDKSLADKAWEWLKESLQNQGVGAKTAVGYGYFGEVEEQNV